MKNIKLNIQRFAISADVEPYLEFEDYPSTNTPLSADNLNMVQRYIKEDIEEAQADISNLSNNKVDKIEGKGLSTNDYTNEEKAKLAGLSNYDDTEIRGDISDLEDSQDIQDTKISELEEENEYLNEVISQLPTTKEESSNITLKNTIKAKLKTFEVEGKSEQDGTPTPDNPQKVKSVKGIENLVDTSGNPDYLYETTEYEKDNNDIIVKNNTTVRTETYAFVEYYIDNLKPNTTYSISFDATAVNNGYISCDIMKVRNSSTGSSQLLRINGSSSGHFTGQFTTPDDTSTMAINLYSLRGTYYENASVEYSNIQIEEGTVAHTPVPYGHWLPVKMSNKNLYDSSFRQQNDSIYCVYGSASENKDIFTLIATASNMYIWGVKNEGVSYEENAGKLYEFDNNTYTVSISNSLFTKNYITYYDENKVSLGFVQKSSNVFSFSKSDMTGAKYFTIRIGYSNSVSGTSYKFSVQLEEGSTSTPYTQHQEETTLIDLNEYDSNDNIIGYYELCSIDDIKDLVDIKDGKAILSKNIDKIILDGSETWTKGSTDTPDYSYFRTVTYDNVISDVIYLMLCNYFGQPTSYLTPAYVTTKPVISGSNPGGNTRIRILTPNSLGITTIEQWITWLGSNNAIVQCVLAEPQEIELKGTYNLKTFEEVTHIEILDDLEPNMVAEGYIDVVPILENLDERLKALEEA